MPVAEADRDSDPQETGEWLEALQAVLEREGPERAHFLLEALQEKARLSGAYIPFSPNTAYINTIPPHLEPNPPGDGNLEWRISSILRWNAMAMVVKANADHSGVGGHIASYASAATLYEVGFNHFLKGPDHADGADLLYIQGHCHARHLRPRLPRRTPERDRSCRTSACEVEPRQGPVQLSASLADAGLLAVRHGEHGPRADHGDLPGAADEVPARTAASPRPRAARSGVSAATARWTSPKVSGAIDIAAREKLDNLIFVVNCNLQRLDGPVRGNGKIIQELEGVFRGGGWNVIKVMWGAGWDALLARRIAAAC